MYEAIQPGASLLLAFSESHQQQQPARKRRRTEVLIIGGNRLAAARSLACLDAGFGVTLLTSPDRLLDPELAHRLQQAQLKELHWPDKPNVSGDGAALSALFTSQHALLASCAFVVITDTIRSAATSKQASRSVKSAASIAATCYDLRIPINVADQPTLSDFTFPAAHRFPLSSSDPKASPLQIAITTNAVACRLASRIKRLVISSLPRSIGSAVDRVGEIRQLVKDYDARCSTSSVAKLQEGLEEREESWPTLVLNAPVEQRSPMPSPKFASFTRQSSFGFNASPPLTPPSTPPLSATHFSTEVQLNLISRMRFIAQICALYDLPSPVMLIDTSCS